MSVKLLTEPHFELLSLKVGCIGSSESTLLKMPHCWKSHVMAHFRCYPVLGMYDSHVSCSQIYIMGLLSLLPYKINENVY